MNTKEAAQRLDCTPEYVLTLIHCRELAAHTRRKGKPRSGYVITPQAITEYERRTRV